MKLYELKRKNLTLGATRPRKMMVSARSEQRARELAHTYQFGEGPFIDALDEDAVACTMVAHDCSYTEEDVRVAFRDPNGMRTLKPKGSS